MKNIFVLFLLQLPLWGLSQDYSVSLIPDSLKANANAVKRQEQLRVVIKDAGRAVVYHKYAITILNENGDDYAVYSNYYDKMHSLSDISGALYDAGGKKLKSVKKKDISDAAYDDDESLVTDARYKKHNFYYRQYPYTVEYEDVKELDGVFFLPRWEPVEDDAYAVQQSALVVETPLTYALRYKQFVYNGTPNIAEEKSVRTYKWEVKHVKPVEYEVYQPAWKEITCSVQLAPVDFEIGGYKGNMSSWQNLGKFIQTLNEGRDVLPDPVKKEVHALVDGIADKREKVRVLYEYMQKNTRYIGIQVGIGGWQPFDAKYVAEKKYGDCKALSNYMKSLLKEVGIPANYVLVRTGEGKKGLWEDFPAPFFTHAILCVPGDKDSLWLECTSSTACAGYMGRSTGNKQALLIDSDGGHVVYTPRYSAADNAQWRRINAQIDGDGNLIADVRTVFTGIQQELPHSLIHYASKEQREKYLNNTLGLPTYKVDKIDYDEQKAAMPQVTENLHVQSPAYASASGKRLFVVPNLFNKTRSKLSTDKPRVTEIDYPYSYTDVDSVFITVPAGYVLESLPKNITLQNKFGRYAISFFYEGNTIRLERVCERNAGRFPPEDYTGLAKFIADMYKADRSTLVLVKNN
ncbi:DUF3857 domain-containing protein [Filimonas lacunae]|nr:DUF3857 domain-containing protein [Filimonas lacunae]